MDGGWASPPGGPSRGELEQGFLWFDAPALESTSMDFSQLLVGMQASPARDSGGPHGDGGGGGGALASPGPLLAALLPNAPLGMPQLPQPAMMMPPMPLPPMPLPQQPVLVPVTQLHAQSSVPAAQHAAAQQAAAAFQQQQAQQAAAAFQQQQGQQAAAAFQQQQAQQAAAAFQQQQAQQGAAAFQQQQGQQAAAAFQQQQAQQEAAQASAQRAAAAFQQQQAQQEQQEAGGAAGGGRGGGGRGGRGGRRRVSEEERRARNRATQARFRERQKVKNDAMAATYAAAESELQRLRGEHAGLESHQAALQKMLFTKDVALGVLGGPLPAAPSRGVGDTTMVQVKAEQQEQQEEEQQQQQQQQASLSVASPRGAAHLSSAHSASTGSAASASASASAGGSATMAGGGDGGGDGLQRRSSSGAGLSRAVARQMEQLGNDLTAHFAQLELPLDAHPDEAMAVGQATLVPSSAAGTAAALPEQAFEGEYEDDEEEWEEEEEGEAEETAAEPAGRAAGSGGGGSTTSSPLVSVRTRSARSGGQARGGEEQRLVQLARARPELLQRILSMSAEEFVADWRQKAAMFRDILHMQGAAPRSPTTQDELDRILSIFKEWSGTFSLTLRHKPENATALFATAATAPAELWRSVAARLEPSRAQRTMLQQLWHSYAGRVQALRAERAAAMEVVQHAAQHAATVTPASLPATTLNGLMSQYLALFDAAGRLSTLRDAEFVAMLQLMGRTGAVFSPLQKARLVAAAHPYFPDVVQVTSALAGGSGGGSGDVQMEEPGQGMPAPAPR